MFRYRVRRPSPPLDEASAERLLAGAPIDDLPDAFQPLGELLASASGPATEHELDGSAAAAAAFVAAHHAANRTLPRKARSVAASVLTALAVVASTGTAVAATQGALPEPMQQVAHEALGVVGIHVPAITDGRDETRTDDVSVSTPPSTTAGATVTTNGSSHGAVVSAAGGATTEPGSSKAPETPPGQEVRTDPGNSGQDQGNAGSGSQGNAYAGEGNSGQGTGAGGNPATPPTTGDDTTGNLPASSNGKGNGPPSVPPGQVNKTP